MKIASITVQVPEEALSRLGDAFAEGANWSERCGLTANDDHPEGRKARDAWFAVAVGLRNAQQLTERLQKAIQQEDDHDFVPGHFEGMVCGLHCCHQDSSGEYSCMRTEEEHKKDGKNDGGKNS